MSGGGEKFWTEGSPLEGKAVPPGWRMLSLFGKRAALVSVGYAANLGAAASLLGRHAAAVKRSRIAIKSALRK
ncbi:MAG: hypothetical protein QM496_02050 [Verrucomicrobiota bacterium]